MKAGFIDELVTQHNAAVTAAHRTELRCVSAPPVSRRGSDWRARGRTRMGASTWLLRALWVRLARRLVSKTAQESGGRA